MPVIETIAKYINEGVSQKNNKPFYNIKNERDEVFWARAPIKNIAQGARVKIEYTVGTGGSKNIVKVEAITNGAGNTSQYRAETGSRDAERIWVNSLLKEYIQSGAVPLDAAALRNATSIIRAAYHQSWDAPQIQSHADRPPDDEIPGWEPDR
jgi:hypothetical protein